MTAPTKAFVNILDTAVDPDSPLDTYLMTGLRDIGIHLKEVLYGSYTATQNHNHDGTNSALVEIGPNAIRNGSFEQDGDGWTITPYTGGSHSFNTANDMDGAKALAITSTVTANGGAVALSGEFRSCIGGVALSFILAYKASVANVSSRARIIWYDGDQAQVSTSDIYTSTNTPTVATVGRTVVTAPSTARFYKVELTGGIPGSGSSAGTIYFDGVKGEVPQSLRLNGQNGDVVTTDLYAIGSTIIGRPGNDANYTVNTTIAGTSLYSCSTSAQTSSSIWSGNSGQSLVNTGSWRCVSQAFGDNVNGYPGQWVRYA